MKKFNPGDYRASAQGFLDTIEVIVTVSEDEIKNIQYRSNDYDDVGKIAIEILSENILKEQRLDIDGMSGATESVAGFKEAMREALNKAALDPDSNKYTPGTYIASAEGFRGTLHLKLTVDKNKILNVEVDSVETPELGGRGQRQIIKEILENQNRDFDTVSGATYTSKAMRAALSQALQQASVHSENHVPTVKPSPLDYPETRIQFESGSLALDEITFILENITNEITYIDRNDRIQYFNPRKNQKSAIVPRSKTNIGLKFLDNFPKKYRKQVHAMLSSFKEGDRQAKYFKGVEVAGQVCSVSYIPLFDQDENYRGLLELIQKAGD